MKCRRVAGAMLPMLVPQHLPSGQERARNIARKVSAQAMNSLHDLDQRGLMHLFTAIGDDYHSTDTN